MVQSILITAFITSLFLFFHLRASLAIVEEYGVDVSFPIHYLRVSTNYPWLPHNLHNSSETQSPPNSKEYENMPIQPLGDRRQFYQDFIQGCQDFYGKKGKACIQTEADRIEMSKRQPASMQNYTDIGFKKIRMPDNLWKLLKNFWEKN